MLKPLTAMPKAAAAKIGYVLSDIDDTLTHEGRLPATAYAAMERLRAAGLVMVPITGRPAGWCDLIARQWPCDGVVGENGAFYYRYDDQSRTMIRRFWKNAQERDADRAKMAALAQDILAHVPAARIASDQAFREADLAIDFAEDVGPLSAAEIDLIVARFAAAGATAKVSSIHVNGWFGDWDKLAMTRHFFAEVLQLDLDAVKDQVVFAGDSPNDQPMFAYFPYATGVANVLAFRDRLAHPPAFVTAGGGGPGFAELADYLLEARSTR